MSFSSPRALPENPPPSTARQPGIMSGKSLLKVARRTAENRSTPDQERFKYLIAQIEKLRQARSEWDAKVLAFRQADTQRLHPLRATLRTATRDTVFAIDRLLDQSGWSRVDRS